ncbi:hypothetical protein ACOMHN_062462 [Nucella lapillus]
MRLDAGSVLLLLSGYFACVTAPRDRREGDNPAMTEGGVGPFLPVGSQSLCPSQCMVDEDVLVCHQSDCLNMVQLAHCVSSIDAISVVDLRSSTDMCSCFLLDYVRLTTNDKVITITPDSCSDVLLNKCHGMLPDRGKNMKYRAVVAGLVMEQADGGWRRATRRHLAWLWNKVNSLQSSSTRNRYRALIIKTVKSVYWTREGTIEGKPDRIVPFMLFKDSHMGPLYGKGRKGWYTLLDFKPAVKAVSDKTKKKEIDYNHRHRVYPSHPLPHGMSGTGQAVWTVRTETGQEIELTRDKRQAAVGPFQVEITDDGENCHRLLISACNKASPERKQGKTSEPTGSSKGEQSETEVDKGREQTSDMLSGNSVTAQKSMSLTDHIKTPAVGQDKSDVKTGEAEPIQSQETGKDEKPADKELFAQFQKIREEEKARHEEWTADKHSSHMDVTPKASSHTWTRIEVIDMQ